jgi:hypothetical protein
MSAPWGRGASEYRPGLLTKQYFGKHGEACAADISTRNETKWAKSPYEDPTTQVSADTCTGLLSWGLLNAPIDGSRPSIIS